jgi:diacylglycerol kinase (ATP)
VRTVPIIVNPAAGGGAGRRHIAEIARELTARGIAPRFLETSGPGAALDLAREQALAGTDLVVAAGGDGTIHEVANGLLQASLGGTCTLALIPVGTGNDFVKVVPGARSRRAAYDTIVSGRRKLYDVGRARWLTNQEYFVNGMGTGIDVEVVRQMRRLPQLPGPLKYLLALFKALFRFQPVALRARIDDQVLDHKLMIIAIGNGVCQGGGFYLAPDASPSDGLLDLCMVHELNWTGIARVIPRILKGTQRGDPAVDMRTVRRIRLEALDSASLFFHLDGELREPAGLRALEVEVVPQALPVLVGSEDA